MIDLGHEQIITSCSHIKQATQEMSSYPTTLRERIDSCIFWWGGGVILVLYEKKLFYSKKKIVHKEMPKSD